MLQILLTTDYAFIEMEKMNGGTLQNVIDLNITKTGALLDEESVASIMRDILSGLLVMHERDYVHRDLKPDNVLINVDMVNGKPTYKAKLADFGLSAEYKVSIYSNSESMDQKMGTILYMAPE